MPETAPRCAERRRSVVAGSSSRPDIRRAVFILELANSCIRLIVGQTQLNEATRTALLAQSAKIDLFIAETRREAAHLFGETDLKLRIADDGKQPKSARCSL
ncbi:hypothetical protein IVA87_23375 [Bradyrhizobium sp. 147]|uniref:hypothetical protein n=1 Tax=Bradyrhizobium sp. 147 TaxID=2782623 RepID=UPI001FFBC6C2|nr:hypothetical protein [Bradyrhizobium sp. 147]MCK1682266.1 hypothetical protein [Bradyrhizobium sp. 147]